MTFEEWKATRREVADLAKELDTDFGNDAPTAGFIYHGDSYVQKSSDEARAGGKLLAFYLCVGNEDWTSDSLDELELKLWEVWAEGETA